MRIIGAGFGRTGTMSLKAALERLGVGPCLHMIDVIRAPELAEPWRRRVAGEPVDWTAALADWGSTVDWPGCSYWEELADVFPDAPILLNDRDGDAWYESCLQTIHAANAPERDGAVADDEVSGMIRSLIWDGTFGGWERFLDRERAIEIFHRHNDEVRERVPDDRLVEFSLGDGWAPLCDALGAPVPDESFPHLNDTSAFREMIGLD